MTAAVRNLIIEQGTSWAKGFRFVTDDEPAVDSSWTAAAHVRVRASEETLLHEWSTAEDTITIDDEGTVTLQVQPEVSSAWTWTYGRWDLEVSKDGVTLRLLEGAVTVSPEVTRA